MASSIGRKIILRNIQLVFTFILTVLFIFDYFLYFQILFSLFKIKYSTCLLETISGGAVVRRNIIILMRYNSLFASLILKGGLSILAESVVGGEHVFTR
jgi:hypothetical protein